MEPIRKRVHQLDQVNKAINWLDGAFVKILCAGKVPYVEIGIESDEPKSDGQREKFHAMIGDIKKTGVIVIPGRRIVMNDYDNEQCKALLVMWFTNEVAGTDIAIPNPPRHFLCPITGENITIRPSTIKWGKKLTCAFVEWLYATGAMAGVKWSEPALKAYAEYREASQ